MKALAVLVTDTHHDKGVIAEVDDILQQSIELAKSVKAEYIFSLGDAFTSRTGQALQVLLARRRWLHNCQNEGIDVIEIPGNHDKTDLDSPDSYLDMYDGMFPNYKLIREQRMMRFGDLVCCFLPYFLEGGSYPQRLADLSATAKKGSGKRLLFTHIAVDGVRNNDGSIVESGVGLDQFKLFDTVFVGHYHNRSVVGKKIHYIGSPRSKDFGEDNEKGFTILYEDGSFEFIAAKFKKHIKVKVDLTKTDQKGVDALVSKYKDSEHKVRFIFTGEDEDLALIPTKDLASVGIDVKKEPLRIARSLKAAEESQFIRFNKSTLVKSFLEYCKENEISGEIRKVGLQYVAK